MTTPTPNDIKAAEEILGKIQTHCLWSGLSHDDKEMSVALCVARHHQAERDEVKKVLELAKKKFEDLGHYTDGHQYHASECEECMALTIINQQLEKMKI